MYRNLSQGAGDAAYAATAALLRLARRATSTRTCGHHASHRNAGHRPSIAVTRISSDGHTRGPAVSVARPRRVPRP
eukprot:1571606-Prymnesium_polylepis.1